VPIRSKAQLRKLALLEERGVLPKGTLNKWIAEAPDVKSLPERKKAGKSLGCGVGKRQCRGYRRQKERKRL
jgi:hypothetical protein